ncbi:MAG: glutamyl-tRNA reductase [Moraxellaceae bacterium]|jgi:glutamyl-tRNA reductase|nr:glutamyl-tRNA reductase [Moraxellaceae bacterium]
MGLLALGINHKTASLDLREKVAFTPDTLADALRAALREAGVNEIAILSTCNRTEFYGQVEGACGESLLAWLAQSRQLPLGEISGCVYQYENEEAVRHMMRVAAGLDSMVLGEPQILGQLKDAYMQAAAAGTLGPALERLFQATFSAAKQVRTDTAIGANPVSVAFAAVQLGRQIFADLRDTEALLIGAGEMIELVGKHLYEQGVTKITVANRTLSRGFELAQKFNGRAISLEDIPEALVTTDIVISSTASPLPILGKGMVERALKKRRHKPVFMVDIAVPRDIEPEVAELDDVYLYSVDDLQSVVEVNLRSRQEAAVAAENIVTARAAQFMTQKREQGAAGLVVAYRHRVEVLRAQEVERALAALRKGQAPEEALERLSRTLANKLLHAPSIAIKKAAADGQFGKLDWAVDLLGLEAVPRGEAARQRATPATGLSQGAAGGGEAGADGVVAAAAAKRDGDTA